MGQRELAGGRILTTFLCEFRISMWVGKIAALFLCILIGCDRSTPPQPPKQDKIVIATSAFPLGEIARQVGGERVDVTWWVESGQSLSGYQPTQEQINRMRRAAIVLTNGVTESAYTDEFSQGSGDRRIVRLDQYVSADHANTQLWLDPFVVKKTASDLAERLAAIDPKCAGAFRDRTTQFNEQIDAMVRDWQAPLSRLQGRAVASIGPDFWALARHVGFVVEVIDDRPPASLDDDKLSKLRQILRQRQAIMLLVEADTPTTVVANLQRNVDVPVVAIDSLGTSSSQGRNSYDKIMRYNFEQLLRAYERGR